MWKKIQRGLKDKPDLEKIFSKHISGDLNPNTQRTLKTQW